MSPKDDVCESIWEAAEEHVQERIARGGPCVSRIHYENMIAEKYEELLDELLEGGFMKKWEMPEKVEEVLGYLNPSDRALAEAAPDMLEALKWVLDHCHHGKNDFLPVKAAISKAETT